MGIRYRKESHYDRDGNCIKICMYSTIETVSTVKRHGRYILYSLFKKDDKKVVDDYAIYADGKRKLQYKYYGGKRIGIYTANELYTLHQDNKQPSMVFHIDGRTYNIVLRNKKLYIYNVLIKENCSISNGDIVYYANRIMGNLLDVERNKYVYGQMHAGEVFEYTFSGDAITFTDISNSAMLNCKKILIDPSIEYTIRSEANTEIDTEVLMMAQLRHGIPLLLPDGILTTLCEFLKRHKITVNVAELLSNDEKPKKTKGRKKNGV